MAVFHHGALWHDRLVDNGGSGYSQGSILFWLAYIPNFSLAFLKLKKKMRDIEEKKNRVLNL